MAPSLHVNRPLVNQNEDNISCILIFKNSEEARAEEKLLRNGPDKNDSNNGNEHVGIQLV